MQMLEEEKKRMGKKKGIEYVELSLKKELDLQNAFSLRCECYKQCM